MILNYEALNDIAFGIEYLEENNSKYIFQGFLSKKGNY